jgi:hypothetical protein
MSDLTELAAAAATNDPRVVGALASSFARSSLHLPLETLEGVKNRPETVEELGVRLPIHRLRLDTGESAIPLFSRPSLCHRCAARLLWKTDGRGVKSLQLPGSVALSYAREVLVAPAFDRVVLNPLSEGELHLARSDIESMLAARELRHLWFYAPGGRLLRPISFVGSSFLDTILATADNALQRIADGGRLRVSGSSAPADAGAIFENLPLDGPLRGLAADLYFLVAAEGFADLELAVSKANGEVRVTAAPEPASDLLDRLRAAAERNLEGTPGTTNVTFRFRGESIVVTSSSTAPIPGEPHDRTSMSSDARATPPPVPRPPSARYIPLEPEPVDEDETRD